MEVLQLPYGWTLTGNLYLLWFWALKSTLSYLLDFRLIDAKPVEFPCQGSGCGESVLTYQTDEDIEAGETLQVLRYTPETGDERLVRYWFCTPDCRAAFAEAVGNGECDERLYDDETPNAGAREGEKGG